MGFKVCPLHPRKKCPVDRAIAIANPELQPIKGGPWRASSLATEIGRWFADVPEANTGIVCCQLADGSWLNIVDYDLPKNRDALRKHAEDLLNSIGIAPKDATYQTTPNGGVHLFLRTTGFRLDNAQDAGGIHGLDVRGQQGRTHGYVVAEGSIIESASKGYAFHAGAARDATSIVEISMAQAIAAGLPIAGPKPTTQNSQVNPTVPNKQNVVSVHPATHWAPTTLMCGTALDWVRSQRDALLADTTLKTLPKDRDLWLRVVVLPLANAAADEPQYRPEFEQIADSVSRAMAGYDSAVPTKLTQEFDSAVKKAGQPGRLGVGSFGYGFGLLGSGSTGTAAALAPTKPGAASAVSSPVYGTVQPPRRFTKGSQISSAARARHRLGDSPLVKGVAGLLVGRGGSAKSTLASHFAFGVAAGGPSPLGWTFGEPGVGRFVTGEDDEADIGRTIAGLALHYGSVPHGLEVCDASCAAGFRLVDAARGGWELNKDGIETLHAMAEGADFLALDSLSLLSGTSVNDNAAMAAVMGAVNRVANQTGAHILILHHKRKGDDEDRGTEAAADSSMGASNVLNMARVALEIRSMSESEAKDRAVADRHRFAGVRVVKSNYGPVGDDPHWLEKRIVDIVTPNGPAKAVRLEYRSIPKLTMTASLNAVRQIALAVIAAAEKAGQPLAKEATHKLAARRAVGRELTKAGHANGMTENKIAGATLKALLDDDLIDEVAGCQNKRPGGGNRSYVGLRVRVGGTAP